MYNLEYSKTVLIFVLLNVSFHIGQMLEFEENTKSWVEDFEVKALFVPEICMRIVTRSNGKNKASK